MRERAWRTPAAVVLGLLISLPSGSADKKRLAIEDLTTEPPLSGQAISSLTWLPGGGRFSYVIQKGSEEDAPSELWLEEARTGRRSRVLGAEDLLLADGTERSGSTPEERPRRIPLKGLQWSPDGKRVLLAGKEDLHLFDVEPRRLERLTRASGREEFPSFSPDGRRVAFVRGGDLHAIELGSRRETRLTRDGGELVLNGRLDWVYEEELNGRDGRAYEWSPDGGAIAYLRLDARELEAHPIADFLTVPATVTLQRYPKAGRTNSSASFRVVALDGSARGAVEIGNEAYVVPRFSWTGDGRLVCYRVLNRSQSRQEVRLFDPAASSSRTLFTEEDRHWLNVVDPPRFLRDGRYVWVSERSGFPHLYVGRMGGGEPGAITSGEWMVDELAGVDEMAGLVYFTATEESPRRRGLYRVALDGGKLEKLSKEPGTHKGLLSPGGRHLLDTFSSLTEPPIVVLREPGGKTLRVVDRPEGRLGEYGLATTEEMVVRAEDGARLLAHLIKPHGFDPSRRYPVVAHVYGGPHGQMVRDFWGGATLFDHYLAQQGFLVWKLDNRGSWGRGHAWEAAIFRETGKRELADQLAGVRHLKALPYVDPDRIGIWGWSYGGYLTLYALTNAPEVWKCGVAGAPVTHWKFYDTIYTERYMGRPEENHEGYERSAPLSRAQRLKAPLLLIHGTADDNVHLQNTLAFVNALTRAGLPYRLQIQPGQKHGFRGRAAVNYRNRAIAEFFEENLLR